MFDPEKYYWECYTSCANRCGVLSAFDPWAASACRSRCDWECFTKTMMLLEYYKQKMSR